MSTYQRLHASCPGCHGTGRCYHAHDWRTFRCPDCNGSGIRGRLPSAAEAAALEARAARVDLERMEAERIARKHASTQTIPLNVNLVELLAAIERLES